MAYNSANMNCAVVGPQKLWIYKTTDSLNSATIRTYFKSTTVPGLAAGDFMLIKTADQVELLNITAASSVGVSVVKSLLSGASMLA